MAKCLHLIIVAVLLMSFICNQLLQSSDVEICASWYIVLLFCIWRPYQKINWRHSTLAQWISRKELQKRNKKIWRRRYVCVCVNTLRTMLIICDCWLIYSAVCTPVVVKKKFYVVFEVDLNNWEEVIQIELHHSFSTAGQLFRLCNLYVHLLPLSCD